MDFHHPMDENLKGQMHLCPPHGRFFEKFRVSESEGSGWVQESMRKVFQTNAQWPEQIFPWRSHNFWEKGIFRFFFRCSSTLLMQTQVYIYNQIISKIFFPERLKCDILWQKIWYCTHQAHIFQNFKNSKIFKILF